MINAFVYKQSLKQLCNQFISCLRNFDRSPLGCNVTSWLVIQNHDCQAASQSDGLPHDTTASSCKARTQHLLDQSPNPRNAEKAPRADLFLLKSQERILQFHDFQHMSSEGFPGSFECRLIHGTKLSAPTFPQKSGTDHDPVHFSKRGFVCFLKGEGNYLSRSHFLKGKNKFCGESTFYEPKNLVGIYYKFELGNASCDRKHTGLTRLALIFLSTEWEDSISYLSHR